VVVGFPVGLVTEVEVAGVLVPEVEEVVGLFGGLEGGPWTEV
jgi:hypothetical protein